MFYIFLIYLFLILFNNIKDFQAISSFFVVYVVLIAKINSMNIVSMKKSFEYIIKISETEFYDKLKKHTAFNCSSSS